MHAPIAGDPASRGDALPGAAVPEALQVAARDSVARSREMYRQGLAAAQGGAKVMAEVAETTWGSAKLLNDRIIQNVAANAEAVFRAAEAMAGAASLPEAARLQGELVCLLLVASGEQMKEFADLSVRAAQHVLETAQDAAARSMRAGG
jgi:hypothetical protein